MAKPDQRPGPAQPVIVVGVDGSTTDRAALTWAVRTATQRHGTVRAVSVNASPELGPARDLADDTDVLDTLIEQTRALVPDAAPVWAVSVTGDPATELARIAAHADLLVVGDPGHGPLAEVYLGAGTSARDAPCPVVVLPREPVDDQL